MAELDVTNIASASIATPASGVTAVYVDGTNAPTKRLRTKDDAGTIVVFVGQDTTDVLTNKTLTAPSIAALANLTSNGMVTTTSGNGTLVVVALGTGVATFLTTPSSANLASALTDETGGSGVAVFNSAPQIKLPTIVDSGDTTKVLDFVLSGATTGTTLHLAASQATTQTLTLPTIREAETVAVRPQNVQFAPANPSLTTSTTGVMMGLSSGATRITPQVTGNIMVIITGMILNSTIGDGSSVQIRVGTGNGPANGAALTGTTVGSLKNFIASTAAGKQGFTCCGFATGLTLNTAIYIDVGLKAVTGGNATISDLDVVAYEF